MAEEAEDLVTLKTCHDSNEARMLKGLLEDEGYVVAAPGLEHRSMLGMAGSFVAIPLKVPRRDLEEARALLDGLVIEDDDEPAVEAPRKRRIAAFVACVLTFGAAHFYVRNSVSGRALLFIEAVAFIVLCGAGQPLAGAVVVGCVVADLVGSMGIISRQRSGKPARSAGGRLAWTLLVAALASSAVVGLIHVLPADPPPDPAYLPPDDWG